MIKYIEWLGVSLAITGALALSMTIVEGYILMLASGVLLGYQAYKINMRGLLTMQATFTIINILGVYNWVL